MRSLLNDISALLLCAALPVPAAVKEFWVYKSTNLLVDANVAEVKSLLGRCKACGVTHLLLADSKFSRLADMDERYFKNAAAVRAAAKDAAIAIVPAVCSIGYSNDILSRDPNLIEAMPVKDVPLEVKGGEARPVPDAATGLRNGDMTDLSGWTWKDENVQAKDGAAYVKNPGGHSITFLSGSRRRNLREHRKRSSSTRTAAR
jgi:hypothetical protein